MRVFYMAAIYNAIVVPGLFTYVVLNAIYVPFNNL